MMTFSYAFKVVCVKRANTTAMVMTRRSCPVAVSICKTFCLVCIC